MISLIWPAATLAVGWLTNENQKQKQRLDQAEKELLGLDGQELRLDLFADELEQVVRQALQIASQTVAEGRPFPPNWEELMFARP